MARIPPYVPRLPRGERAGQGSGASGALLLPAQERTRRALRNDPDGVEVPAVGEVVSGGEPRRRQERGARRLTLARVHFTDQQEIVLLACNASLDGRVAHGHIPVERANRARPHPFSGPGDDTQGVALLARNQGYRAGSDETAQTGPCPRN